MQRAGLDHVRFGSKADMTLLNFDVRFTPESGHPSTQSKCPLWAISGRSHQLWSSCIAEQSLQSHAARDGCEVIEWRGRSRRAPPIREAAFASQKAPVRLVRAPVDPTDASEER
jgi:hypothetical protein